MKLNTTAAPVIVSGGGATSQFSIAVNAKAFRVLSDTMYQNKIGSICRELCCNAKDSHVSANKQSVPFIVHIPDSYEPWFAVQDFGMGLSPDDIANVFTVYFQSTKDSSNETVGAFGLGAKTPFSYTDQFTVTSVYNGIRRIYSAFINETGLPTIVEMAEAETTDGNGVEIKMSVKREDFQKFRNEVAQQLRFFKVKPTIQNCSGFTWPALEKDFVIENNDVTIAKSGSGYGANKFFIIQGEVGYPLDIGQINGKITAENAELVNRLSSNQVCLFFNIGEIGVTASREGVEYNPETVKHIDAKLTTARKKLEDYITAQLASCKTTWEKVQFLNRGTICQLAQASGITLPNVKKSNGGNYYFDISSLIREERTRQATPTSTPVKYMAPTGDFKYWQRYKSSRLDASSDNFTPPENDAGIMFIVRDTANRPNVRAKYLFEGDSKLTTIYEFSTYDRENTDWDAFINKLSVLLGGYPTSKIVKLSDVELPAKIVDASGKVRATYTRPTHYCFTNTDITSVRSWDRNYDGLESVEDEVVYVARHFKYLTDTVIHRAAMYVEIIVTNTLVRKEMTILSNRQTAGVNETKQFLNRTMRRVFHQIFKEADHRVNTQTSTENFKDTAGNQTAYFNTVIQNTVAINRSATLALSGNLVHDTLTDIYGLLVVRNAYTPVSAEVFTVRLVVVQDA